jgi:hypothetical protein
MQSVIAKCTEGRGHASTDPNCGHMQTEERMRAIYYVIALAFAGICTATPIPTRAKETVKALQPHLISTASVSLDQGLRAGVAQGIPISGKFEIEGDALQLSVYLLQEGKFSEVIVDPQSGFIKKAWAIADIKNLKAANAHSQAMAKAKVSLDKAVRDSVSANPGFSAASVIPILLANRPIAEIVLMKGADTKWDYKPLD